MLKRILLSFIILSMSCGILTAQTLEDAQKAYQEGDYKKAHEIFMKFAEEGNAAAQFVVAYFWDKGLLGEEDRISAFQWYVKSAEQGIAEAQHELGMYYLDDKILALNIPEGMIWFEKAANQGMVPSMLQLGKYYLSGDGIEKDVTKAIGWYKKAAELNSTEAMYKLGDFYYYQGIDGVKNPEEGIRYFEMAANMGYTDAMAELGDIYNDGIRIESDPVKAMKWYYLAAEMGDEWVKEPLAELFEFMSDEDIKKAEGLITEWKQKYGK